MLLFFKILKNDVSKDRQELFLPGSVNRMFFLRQSKLKDNPKEKQVLATPHAQIRFTSYLHQC